MLARHGLGPGVGATFTDRYGGVSVSPYAELNLGGGSGDDMKAVAANRSRVARALGLEPARVAWMRQQHGNVVAHVQEAPGESARKGAPLADALVTTIPNLALAVLVADCVPVLLADSAAGVVGVAHAGRPGLARDVVPALVDRAVDLGADPRRVTALLGPAICGPCYEVPDRLRDEVSGSVPAAWCTTWQGSPALDIRAGVTEQLQRAGVSDVRRDARCTRESPEVYSYRRDGRTGRFAGYVWLDREPNA